MAKTASEIWRDFTTDGAPSSGAWNPKKGELREWGGAIEDRVAAVEGQAVEIDGISATVATHEAQITDLTGKVALVQNGFNDKAAVDVTTFTNLTLSGEQTIDGFTTSGSRVCAAGQTTAAARGVYLTAAGAWTRVADIDDGAEMLAASFLTLRGQDASGNSLANARLKCITPGPITLGTTALTFAVVGGSDAATTTEVQAARVPLAGGTPAASLKVAMDAIETKANSAAAARNGIGLGYMADGGITVDLAANMYVRRDAVNPANNEATQLAGKVATTRSTAKKVIGRDNIMFDVAANTNAFDFDGRGGEPLGMRVDPARTSFNHYTNHIGGFTNTRLETPTQNVPGAANVGPDGQNNMTLLKPTNVSGNHIATGLFTGMGVAGDDVIYSAVYKRESGSSANLRLASRLQTTPSVIDYAVNFNLTTGEASVVSGAGSFVFVKVGNDCWWCGISHKLVAFTYMQPVVWILASDMSSIHNELGGLLACKVRVDKGRKPVAPVDFGHATNFPTTDADRPVVDITGLGFTGKRGSLTITASAGEDGADYSRVLGQYDAGDNNNRVVVTNGVAGTGSLRYQVIAGGSVVYTSAIAVGAALRDNFTVAVTWRDNQITGWVDGVKFDDGKVTLPSSVYTTYRIGHEASGASQWHGPIRRIDLLTRASQAFEMFRSLLSSSTAAVTRYILLLMWGQSNEFDRNPGGDITVNPRVLAWNWSAGKVQPANLNDYPFGAAEGAPANSNSQALHRANLIAEENPDAYVVIVKRAHPGKPLWHWADPDDAVADYRVELFADAANASAALGGAKVKGMFGSQCENDADYYANVIGGVDTSRHFTEELYRNGLISLYNLAAAQSWADKEMVFVMNQPLFGGTNGTDTNGDPITTHDREDAIMDIGNYSPRYLAVPSYGISGSDNLHWDAANIPFIARRGGRVFMDRPGPYKNPADKRRRWRNRLYSYAAAWPRRRGARNTQFFIDSAVHRSGLLDPMYWALDAEIEVANLGPAATSTVTISIASPGVVTWSNHGRAVGDAVIFTTTGALPTGVTAGAFYFVKTVIDQHNLTVSDTFGGTVVATTGAQSGTHTCTTAPQITAVSGQPASATVTMTIASPCVVTWTAHGRKPLDPVMFTTTGALPTGVAAQTTLFVRTAIDANNLTLSATPNGPAIATTGAQSGVHTAQVGMSRIFTPGTASPTTQSIVVPVNKTLRMMCVPDSYPGASRAWLLLPPG